MMATKQKEAEEKTEAETEGETQEMKEKVQSTLKEHADKQALKAQYRQGTKRGWELAGSRMSMYGTQFDVIDEVEELIEQHQRQADKTNSETSEKYHEGIVEGLENAKVVIRENTKDVEVEED